jgi:taurine transport system permease protein
MSSLTTTTQPSSAASSQDGDRARRVRAHGAVPSWSTVVAIAGLVALWWLIAGVGIGDTVLLPTPPDVAKRLITLVQGSFLWESILISTERVLIGWGAAVIAGVIVGALMVANGWVRAVVDPLVEFGRPIPPLAFAPLLVVWFGIGEMSKDVVIFIGAFPVIVIATASAFAGVSLQWRRAALTLGASQMYMTRKVILPGALPEILTALRIASGLSWGSLVAAEMIASSNGLGFMILQASRFVDTSTVVVGIVVIGTLAFTMDRVLRAIERRLVSWKGRGD